MTAMLNVKKSFCPLTKSWGYSVYHEPTSDACWGFSETEAIATLMKRLTPKGYSIAFLTE